MQASSFEENWLMHAVKCKIYRASSVSLPRRDRSIQLTHGRITNTACKEAKERRKVCRKVRAELKEIEQWALGTFV